MKFFLPLLFLFTFLSTAFAQSIPKKVTEAEVKKYDALFDDADFFFYTGTETYNLKGDSKNKLVNVDTDYDYYFANISDESYYTFYEGFSGDMEVDYSNSKTQYLSTYDVKVNGIFHGDYKELSATVRSKGKNTITPIKFEKHIKDAKYLTVVGLQDQYDIREKNIVFSYPENIKVEIAEFNFDEHDITKKEWSEKGLKNIQYTIKDLKKFERESNAPGYSFVAPHLLVMVKEVENEFSVFSDTKEQYQWYKGLVEDAGNETEELTEIVASLTKNKTTDLDKIAALFYWVQDKIRYVAFEDGIAGFKPDNCQNVYSKRYGDCKGMANLLKEMLIIAGYDGRMTWIGTNSVRYDYSYTSLAVDNHAICSVLLDDEFYFLDATEEWISVGDYAERIQGRPALIEDGENYIIKKVPSFDYDRNLETTDMNLFLVDSELQGSIKQAFNGESKTHILRGYSSLKSEHKEDAKPYLIIGDDNNIHVDNIDHSDFEKRSGTLTINADVNIENKASEFGEEIYLEWDLYQEFSDYTIDSTRVYDYLFQRKVNMENNVTINLPSEIHVETLPEPYKVENEDFNIQVNFANEGNKIKIFKKIVVPTAKIQNKNIATWNESIDALKELYETQIVLSK